jgi:lambda family phage portal protein
VDTFATTIVGPGLMPLPAIDSKASGLSREEISRIHALQRAIYRTWHPIADAGGRMTFGAIQYLIERNMMVYGEYLVLVRMLDTGRPYYLSLQVVNPQRLRTPIDLWNNPSIKDGVELGANGEPVAYWIKKSTTSPGSLPDTSANFLRVPARTGHRKNVFHGFIQTEPEQVRGWPSFAPALKFFKDPSDYLDAELVSNIVTAALALFIQIGGNDAYGLANQLATLTDEATLPGAQPTRYQELVPGSIMYGNQGETPHLISPNRPGQTFEPFTRTIKKGIAYSLNQPYAALFKDTDGVSFAGFRSAMLEAWRTYEQRRTWLGEAFCAPVWTMLMEEAYLRGEWDVPDFYEKMAVYTNSRWQGPPKGDIEPVKQMQTDVLAIRNNLKTRSASINERGGDLLETFDTLQEEQEMMEERNLTEEAVSLPTPGGGAITREAGSVTPPEEEQASLSAISEVLARVEEMAATIDDIRGGMAL